MMVAIKRWMPTFIKPFLDFSISFEDKQGDLVSTYFFRSFLFNGRSEGLPLALHCWS
jgi:hypothetical protein